MDFTPTQEQAAARELAARVFGDLATHERLKAAGTGTDPELWKALCAAGLPEAVEATGLLGLVLLAEEQGRVTAQVPFTASCVYGLLAVARHGTDEQRARLLPGLRDGTTVVAGALDDPGRIRSERDGEGGSDGEGGWGRLTGTVDRLPWLRDATHVLVPDRHDTLWLVPLGGAGPEKPRPGGAGPGVTVTPVELTAPWAAGRLVLDGARGERIGGGQRGAGGEADGAAACASVRASARIAFAGLQAGVCAGSLARAVTHTSGREQFGRPLATRQAVQLRAADAYMDIEAIRVTAYEAAWRHDRALPAEEHALTAAWWASEAGKRVVHAGQHLHGGMGADLGHPVHRHFLWGRQLDAHLGCGTEVLAALGDLLARGGGS
ncbi:acyl-CoA dehydrogenase family protein [Streptomyces sp. NPDC048577]|uniref:acyl-CoA dehydrogenase family protein n=1 Tax=Streptomyces sp. NPDC048577 TaxID=3157209 RepID=UPI00344663D0